MKKILFIALSAFILSACTQPQESKENTEPSIETLNILTIPRDSLSLEQRKTMLEISLIMDEKLVLEDRIFVLKATEEDFKAKGVDLYYFNLMKKGVSETNESIKNESIENIEEVFKESKKQLKMEIESLSR